MRLFHISFLALLCGCQDYVMNGVEKRQPQMLVYPQEIDFGRLDAGTQTGHESFVIVNTGDDDLTIFSPELVSGNHRFAIDDSGTETITIAGGELLEVDVYYNPETFETNGAYVSIEGNDELNPSTSVLLTGSGDAPVIGISPLDFDYGYITIGCDNEERITIENLGNQDLVVESIVQMVTQPPDILFELGSLPEPPWVIVPGQQIDFLVSYIPTDVGADLSEISITSNDPVNAVVETSQIGDGDVEKWFSDIWIQEQIPVVDVLWVIDNSGSMGLLQSSLSLNVSSFMNVFASSGADYHMAVITTDTSTFSHIITPTTPNASSFLSSLVVTGVNGAGMEKGIEMAYNSLSSSSYAGPGGSFFREDAVLIVIFVSDEPDWSSPWTSYLPFFDSIKPPGQFIPYGVIGDVPGGCVYNNSNGHPRNILEGLGYWDLIDYYGGNWYSICATDWGLQLQDLAGEVTNRRSFSLSELDPIEYTIEVIVNGQATTDWTYDAPSNSVRFNDGHSPNEGQTIEINYAIWGCGE